VIIKRIGLILQPGQLGETGFLGEQETVGLSLITFMDQVCMGAGSPILPAPQAGALTPYQRR
jgi:hypothetical protein